MRELIIWFLIFLIKIKELKKKFKFYKNINLLKSLFLYATNNYYIKIILFCVIIISNTSVISIEVTVYLPIYEPLSKTISTSIPGASKIVIDRKNIKKNENFSLNEILNQEAGINNRSIYGSKSSGSKSTVDIRGMGAQAKSNVLILINGQRLNNIDMSEIDFPSIPLESIDRIEIFKGNAATVLYGDGVIGGAINIITNTKINKKNINEIIVKQGSFNTQDIAWRTSQTLDQYSFTAYFNHTLSDGYRDENEQQQNNFTSELRYPGVKGDHFFNISFSEQIMSTPGDRSQDQLYSDRKGSDTPDDFINSLGSSLLYGADYKLNEDMKFILNSSFRLKDSYSDLQSTSYPSYSDTSLTNYQFTPRINHISNFYGIPSKSTYGFDLQYADYESHRKKTESAIPLHIYDAWQSTQSIYSQQTLYLSDNTNIGSGFRIQRNLISIKDQLNTSAPDYEGWQTEHKNFSDKKINFAFNLGLDHTLNSNSTIYGRIGNGFRYPNVDDRIGGSGDTSLELKTQKTKDFEIGSRFLYNNFSSNISTYLIEGKNELTYDTDAFQNMNMNSTRRYGIELNIKNKISNNLNLINNFTFSKAKYTSGDQGTYATDFKDKDVPLVPQYSLNTNLEFQISEFTRIIPSIKFQDDMRMESDDENFQETKIPSYILANLSISSKFNNFFSTLIIDNIFDSKYHNYAISSSNTLGVYNAYPEPGRTFTLSFGSKF